MDIIISASNAFSKWMELDLAYLPSENNKQKGRVRVYSDEYTQAWQCHLIDLYRGRNAPCIIAIESFSRYCIVMHCVKPMTRAEFEKQLITRWANQALSLAFNAANHNKELLPHFMQNFQLMPLNFSWYRNTDLSINGHIADTEQWLVQGLEHYNIACYNDNEIDNIVHQVNQMMKQSKLDKTNKKQRFYPIDRLIQDGLYRLGYDNPLTQFPCPIYEVKGPKVSSPTSATPLPDNVVSLDAFRQKSS